ncbi:NAC domain-containing protein 83-like [Aristolochia californica]|uniref:NAC domain-containing protein 83-like n=1 Tax=Aristolochia californica TaxID=171875 RepID=UPI0035D6E472
MTGNGLCELVKREGAWDCGDLRMEKPNFFANGVVRLPPGFRFQPTDEELVVEYLKRKVFSCPLPASIIPEIDVSKFDPWDLPGNSERERYFFTKREAKYPNGNRANRATGSGFWKATGKDKQIVASRTNQLVGVKKVLVFYRANPPKGSRTDWIMHEYRLSDAVARACISPQRKNSMQSSFMPMEDWVLCRIFLKKRSNRDAEEELIHPCIQNRFRDQGSARVAVIDFMNRRNNQMNDASSDSEASGITELSSTGSVNEEITSFNSNSSSSPGREA